MRDFEPNDNKNSKVFKNKLVMKEMELKLVAEIKESQDQKSRSMNESPVEPILAVSGISHDPVAQLVSELSQTFNLERETDIKDDKIQKSKLDEPATFVSQLKKADSILKKNIPKEKPISNEFPAIIDFKSRLRKVENNTDKKEKDEEYTQPELSKNAENEQEGNKRESTASSDSGNLKSEELDDKRKSTGSISSLKKLWEPRDSETSANVQLSPKLVLKNSKNEENADSQPMDLTDDSLKTAKIEKQRIWPPTSEDKPIIPTKPPVKSGKPLIANRPVGSAIYATPIATANIKPPISAKPVNFDTKTPEEETKVSSNDKSEKENILEISQALESTLNSIKVNPSVSTATWLQLSDKIGLFHGSCMDYADNVVPAHTKFQFRELLTRLELQARQLRSAGSRNTSENSKYLNEVNNTIKDVVNVVFR